MNKQQALNSGLQPGCRCCAKPIKKLGGLCPACSRDHREQNMRAFKADKAKRN